MREVLEIKNNKIIIPSYFDDLYKTNISAIVSFDKKKISIVNESEIEKYANQVNNYFNLLLSTHKISYRKYLSYKRYYFSKLYFYLNQINSKRELLLPKKALDMVGIEKTLFLSNENSHLEIYKSEQDYKLSL